MSRTKVQLYLCTMYTVHFASTFEFRSRSMIRALIKSNHKLINNSPNESQWLKIELVVEMNALLRTFPIPDDEKLYEFQTKVSNFNSDRLSGLRCWEKPRSARKYTVTAPGKAIGMAKQFEFLEEKSVARIIWMQKCLNKKWVQSTFIINVRWNSFAGISTHKIRDEKSFKRGDLNQCINHHHDSVYTNEIEILSKYHKSEKKKLWITKRDYFTK